ncbi:MAG: IS21-like element helper ATPase IstB [Balneolales bacterium]
MEAIKNSLTALRLSGMQKTLDERHRHALDQKISYLEFLELLLEDEQAVRAGKSYQRRLNQSRLNQQKRLETYDFSFQPELDKRLLSELAGGRYIEQKQNVVLMGKPGVGKTHLANALGLKAVEQGQKVLLVHANELIEDLNRSRADDSYQRLLKKLVKYDLLIIDELGFKSFPSRGTDDFFEVIRRRYEHASTIITTNRDFQGWETLFGDVVIASAIIDRIVHHGHIIKILGESYRLKPYKKDEKSGSESKPKNP